MRPLDPAPRALLDIASRNLSTRYEIGLYHRGALLGVLAYSARKTKGILLDFAREHGERIGDLWRADDPNPDAVARWDGKRSAWQFGACEVRPTGATEYERANAIHFASEGTH